MSSVCKQGAVPALCCNGVWLRLPLLALQKKGCSVKNWGTWMDQHCSINIKWDYSPAVVSLLSAELLKWSQNSSSFQMGGASVHCPDHPAGTSGNRLHTWPLQKCDHTWKVSYAWVVLLEETLPLSPPADFSLSFSLYFCMATASPKSYSKEIVRLGWSLNNSSLKDSKFHLL